MDDSINIGKRILKTLNNNGFEAYFVGEAVRNFILKKKIVRVDITTNANIMSVKKLFMEYDFIDGISIDELEKSYIEGIKWLWYRSETRPEDLKEIIGILRQHGIEYNDMIDVYGFKTEIVEEYENEHYEQGYGDIK